VLVLENGLPIQNPPMKNCYIGRRVGSKLFSKPTDEPKPEQAEKALLRQLCIRAAVAGSSQRRTEEMVNSLMRQETDALGADTK
jgi:hypothetical protein